MIDPHGEYASAFKTFGGAVRRQQPPDALLADELRGALRSVPHQPGLGPADRCGHPRQVPAPGASRRTGWPPRSASSPSTRRSPICSPISPTSSSSRWARSTRRPTPRPISASKAKIDEIKADPRYAFMFSGMLVGGHDGEFPRADLPACPATASRSRSSTSRACLRRSPRWSWRCSAGWCSITRSGRATSRKRPILLVCEEAHRYVPNERNADGSSVRPHPRAHRQGGPQVRRLAWADHSAPVGPGRGRALAVRHDHCRCA